MALLLLLLLTACGGHEVDFARSLAVAAPADLILRNGKIVTVDRNFSIKEAVAVRGGRVIAVGSDRDVRPLTGHATRVIDLGGRTVIPGLIDAQIHATEAGLSWDAELHWEMTRTLADGLRQIAAAAKAKSAGSWIVVGGGWVPTQFAEKRFPTRAELDAIAPRHPIYIQYLRQGALLNSAALLAAGIEPTTADPAGGKFEHNPATGELTGWLQGEAAWQYVYQKIPRLNLIQIRQSLTNCFRELNRRGLTSIGDVQTTEVTFAHRRLLADMARSGNLSLRVNFYLAPDPNGDPLAQIKALSTEIQPLPKSDLYRFVGFAGTLVRGVDADDVRSDSKDIKIDAEAKEKLRRVAHFFAEAEVNFHLQATHDSTARQLLDVLEEVQTATPFTRQRIAFDSLEDATAETIGRIKKLGGAISVQSRLALTGERNVELWGLEQARNTPPLRTMIDAAVPLGAGSDGFRASSYSPMLSLWWLITGKTVAGSAIRSKSQNLTREEALRLYTMGSAWLTFDDGRKGSIEPEKLADLVVLNADYLTVPEDQIRFLESLLTIVGGRVVYAAVPFVQFEK
ncbi:MAG: amidohydrolase [Candidatus Binatia bacterium]